MNILIADTNENFVEYFKVYFESQGHWVQIVRSASASLKILKSNNPVDVIVSEYYLSDITGIELKDLIFEHWQDPVPFILYTYNMAKIDPESDGIGLYALVDKESGFPVLADCFSDIQREKGIIKDA